MHTLDSNLLCAEQKWDITCTEFASQSHCGNKNTSYTVVISANGILQQEQYIHCLKHDVTIALHSIVPLILHEFYNCKYHQGTICTFEAIEISYWSPKLHDDVLQYINKCDKCAQNLPNMAKYLQKHLEIPQTPMAILAIDIIDCLPCISKGTHMGFNTNLFTALYVFAVPMKEKSAENVIQTYLSGVLAHEQTSVAILIDDGTEI